MAPVVFTVELCVIVEPLAVNVVRGVVPPTAPVKVIVPVVPLVKLSVCAPFTVEEKTIFAPAAVPPLFVVSIVAAQVSVTGPVIVTRPPLVV